MHGTTDSEHLAALYMTYLTRDDPGSASWTGTFTLSQMANALLAAVETIIRLQQSAIGANKVQASSLNVCVSDGSQLVALRYRNHAIEQPPSLYYSTTAGVTLNRKYPDTSEGVENPNACRSAEDHGVHIIVASEPSTYKNDDWHLMEKNQLLVVDAGGRISIDDVEFGEDLMAPTATGRHF